MVDIRAASKSDLALVQDLAHRIWHAHYPGIITLAQIDYMLANGYSRAALEPFLMSTGAGLALAWADAMPVGYSAWLRSSEPATTKLDKLYVLPEFQRTGIGRSLIGHVEAAARADGATAMTLNVNKHNEAAIAAYRKCGFSVRDELVIDIGGGFVMDDFLMTRRL